MQISVKADLNIKLMNGGISEFFGSRAFLDTFFAGKKVSRIPKHQA